MAGGRNGRTVWLHSEGSPIATRLDTPVPARRFLPRAAIRSALAQPSTGRRTGPSGSRALYKRLVSEGEMTASRPGQQRKKRGTSSVTRGSLRHPARTPACLTYPGGPNTPRLETGKEQLRQMRALEKMGIAKCPCCPSQHVRDGWKGGGEIHPLSASQPSWPGVSGPSSLTATKLDGPHEAGHDKCVRANRRIASKTGTACRCGSGPAPPAHTRRGGNSSRSTRPSGAASHAAHTIPRW